MLPSVHIPNLDIILSVVAIYKMKTDGIRTEYTEQHTVATYFTGIILCILCTLQIMS